MKIKPHQIFLNIGVSFLAWISIICASNAQTWYDAEGRELKFAGKSVIRKEVNPKNDGAKNEITAPIIPKSLELRPDLSTEPSQRSCSNRHPYFFNNYYRSNFNYYHAGYQEAYPQYFRTYGNYYGNGCFQPESGRRHVYLNCQRGSWLIQSRF